MHVPRKDEVLQMNNEVKIYDRFISSGKLMTVTEMKSAYWLTGLEKFMLKDQNKDSNQWMKCLAVQKPGHQCRAIKML